MKKTMAGLILGLAAAMLTGCIDDQTTLTLNKDGSGTLVQEVFFSPQMASMTESMGAQMGAAMGGAAAPAEGAPAPAPAAVDPLTAHKAEIEKRIAAVGPGAKLEKKEARTSAKGWKGFALTYSFADVTKLNLFVGAGPGDGDDEGDKPAPLKIQFQKTPKAAVGFWAPPNPKKAEAAAAPAAEANPMGDAMGAAMMGPMLQGMRMAFRVEVNGKITRTNSANKEGDSAVVLLDLPVDKAMANPQAAKLMSAGGDEDPDMLNKLRALKIAGLKIDDLEKGIAIEFE